MIMSLKSDWYNFRWDTTIIGFTYFPFLNLWLYQMKDYTHLYDLYLDKTHLYTFKAT